MVISLVILVFFFIIKIEEEIVAPMNLSKVG